MKKVVRFETSDGKLHETRVSAISHADKRYGDLLTSLAHKLVRIEKYNAMGIFIADNIDQFVELATLRKDYELEPDDEDS